MLETKITEMLGIRYPIIGGTMMDLSKAEFVAAISNAGMLGIIASAIFKEPSTLQEEIKKTKDLTNKPFGVNINLFPMMQPPDNNALLDVMAEEGVRIVETSGFAPPEDLVQLFKSHNMTWIHKCVGVRYALKARKLGADAVTVVGYENGGATGKLNVTTMVLVPSTVDALDIPVIGGGGIADGRGLYAVLALGAEGVIIGTRLMLSEECPIHPNLKQALCQATELDTTIVMDTVNFAHRCWINEPVQKIQEIEARGGGIYEIYPYASGEAALKMYQTGDLQAGTVSCSQSVGLMKKVMPLKDMIEEIVAEARAQHSRLAGFGLACEATEGVRGCDEFPS